MKILTFLCTLFLTCSFTFLNEPCDLGCLQIKAQTALSDFTFIKQFPVEITNGTNMDISYVLSNNVQYRIVVADNGIKGQRLIIKLLDRNKKLITTNWLPASRQLSSNIDFTCPATGVYYIETSVEKNHDGSGLVILGFKKTGNPTAPVNLE